MHHWCSSSDVPLSPLPLHPTEPHSFVLGNAAYARLILNCEILISGWIKETHTEREGAVRHCACACLCLVFVHAAVGTLDGKLYTGITEQQISDTMRGIRFFPNCVDECLNQSLSLSGFASLKSYDWMLIIFYSTSIVWRLHQTVTDVLRGWFCSFVLPFGHGPFVC